MWSRDGRELFYRRGAQALGIVTDPALGGQSSEFVAVDISLDGTPEWGNERILPIAGYMTFPWHRDYDIMPDGERFIMIFPEGAVDSVAPDRPQINIVQNWFEELKERVPAP